MDVVNVLGLWRTGVDLVGGPHDSEAPPLSPDRSQRLPHDSKRARRSMYSDRGLLRTAYRLAVPVRSQSWPREQTYAAWPRGDDEARTAG